MVVFSALVQVPSISVSMVDTEGKSFENPGYEAEGQVDSNSRSTPTSVPAKTDKVIKHSPLLTYTLDLFHSHLSLFRGGKLTPDIPLCTLIVIVSF